MNIAPLASAASRADGSEARHPHRDHHPLSRARPPRQHRRPAHRARGSPPPCRYDGYGRTIATSPTSLPAGTERFKYQGRLDIAPPGLDVPLYEFSARFYAPGLGAFTQADTLTGSALEPLSLNRYLYAHANPATMIDPTGETPWRYQGQLDFAPAGLVAPPGWSDKERHAIVGGRSSGGPVRPTWSPNSIPQFAPILLVWRHH